MATRAPAEPPPHPHPRHRRPGPDPGRDQCHPTRAQDRGFPAVWASLFLPKRGVLAPPKSVSTILEGHATWAERQTLKRLFGTAADFREGPKSWRYRLHNRDIVRRFGPRREAYEQGSRLIAQAVAELGTGLVNQIWKDLSLLPTEKETTDPAAWIHRIERGLTSA
ncbi:zinc-dependent metalloprotease [Streptomyces xylophagus]|uniref:zinc-dependent metalloprotease n=1 Tax=Streptomyces xylophagus TaxID=285514 RepID=UPI000A3F71B2|nr:zinc-dependent metalloprotease [Streptomyces xylophagus]